MTNEEARSNLEKLSRLYDDGMIDFSIIRESIKVAISALEKQIPKKYVQDGLICKCPSCDGTYIPILSNTGYDVYCSKCGQRIDYPCFEEDEE